MGGTLSDFWWLERDQTNKFTYLELGHNEPVGGSTSPNIKLIKCQSTSIDEFRSEYQNINLYRSLKLSENPTNGTEITGPFLVDIDNENDLEAAQQITKQTVQYLTTQNNLSPVRDFRIFFTGHKGFNIEIKPQSIAVYDLSYDQETLYGEKRIIIIRYLRKLNSIDIKCRNFVDNNGTIIDLIHNHVRLHDSINSWIDNNGKVISRRKKELIYTELFNKSITDICDSGEL